MRRSERGRGIATQALRLLTALALEEFDYEHLWLEIDAWHEASLRVAAKAGYRFHRDEAARRIYVAP